MNEEFSKIKVQNLQHQTNKKLKLKTIEKKIKRLLKDIELILKTNGSVASVAGDL